MLIDTHAHLDFPDFAGEIEGIVARAREAGVSRILTVGTDAASSRRAVELAEAHPGVIHAIVGIHPNAAAEAAPEDLQTLRELARHPAVAAIGETGLDYYRLPSLRAEGGSTEEDAPIKASQEHWFKAQLELAVETGLNVVIHQRGECRAETHALLAPYTGRLRAVFHCFNGTPEEMATWLELGHLVSFTGIVTFKNAQNVHQSATAAPAGRFMVETDCPFLAPIPHRGQRCEPAFTRLTAERIATLRGETLEQIARDTTATAEDFFRLSPP